MNLDNAKRWWRSKTIWLGAHLMGVSPLLQYAHDNVSSLHEIVGKFDAAIAFALGAVIVWLRNVTSKPIGKPAPVTITVPQPVSEERA